jgi:NAD(P)H-dependent flavin oxidoreductase YrpB (nitropropane dioxygenase family)
MSITALFGIDLPIIQAPMAGVQGSALAIAVSQAGGLGSLPGAMLTADTLAREIAAIRAATDRPFNVNFFCHTPPVPDAEREAAWRAALSPTTGSSASTPRASPAARAAAPSAPNWPTPSPLPAAGGELPLRPARPALLARVKAGAPACCRPPPPWKKPSGLRPTAPTPSSPRARSRRPPGHLPQ